MQTDTPNNNPEDVAEQATPESELAKTDPPKEDPPKEDPPKKDSPKKDPPKKRKQKRHPIKSLLRILLALIIIAAGIYLILFIVAYASRYDSIGSMLDRMFEELSLMWQRIRS